MHDCLRPMRAWAMVVCFRVSPVVTALMIMTSNLSLQAAACLKLRPEHSCCRMVSLSAVEMLTEPRTSINSMLCQPLHVCRRCVN